MFRKVIVVVLAAYLLQSPAHATWKDEEFKRFLKEHEFVRQVVVNGPFTALDIHYSKPGSYLTSTQLFYWRVAYKDKVYLERVNDVQSWEGVEPATLLINRYDDNESPLHVLTHENGIPVMERVALGASPWYGNASFQFGYSLDVQTRYFPRHYFGDGGFLLKAHPLTATALPTGLELGCCQPWINTLAGISPDGEAYVYVDRPEMPSALLVVNRKGQRQAPIPIALTRIFDPRKDESASRYQPLWAWLPMHFKWVKDAAGNWNLAPPAAATAAGNAVLESLFISPQSGYRTCFAPSNSACTGGWREASEDVVQRVCDKRCERAEYAYVPQIPLNAFDTPVELLAVGAAYSSVGYALYLRGHAENVVDAIERRFTSRKINYLRVNQCPPGSVGGYSCLPLLAEKFHWPLYLGDQLAVYLERSEENGAVFVTTNAAFVVRQLSEDVTAVHTLARYDFSPIAAGRLISDSR